MNQHANDLPEQEDAQLSRRNFLKSAGKLVALSALAHFSMIGKAQSPNAPQDVCNGNYESFVPGLDKCGVEGTPDEPEGCGLSYWACWIFAGHRPE